MDYIAYIRTSTDTQNNGLEAQERAIQSYLDTNEGNRLETYVEQVSGRKNNREELTKALVHCKKAGATLLVSKLDRLSRRVSFIANLMESKVKLHIVDMPNADNFTLHIWASLGEKEAQLISERTKQALSVLKAKGVKLGSPLNKERSQKAKDFALSLLPTINQLKEQGITSYYALASKLNDMGIKTFTNSNWKPMTVSRTLKYINT